MILLVLVIPLVVGGLVVPFCVGLVRGPRPPADPVAATAAAAPMQPLGTVARLYGGFLLLYVLLVAMRIKDGFYGSGVRRGAACVTTGIGGPMPAGAQPWRARPGTSLGSTGNLQACVLHPTAGQWALLTLTELPSLLLWGALLLMIARLVRHAAQHGPFTPRAAALMRQLGWLILAGCVVVGVLDAIGTQVLTDAVLTPQPYNEDSILADVLVWAPLQALVPVPALAGIALLSFARITKTGAVMDEELRATV